MILLSACGNAEAPTDDSINSTSESTASSMESSTTTGSDDVSSTSKNFDGKTFSVTYEQAVADFQEAYPNAVISSVDFDKDFGKYTFEISGFDDMQEIEWEVNAENGVETKNNIEKKDPDFDDQELAVDNLMTINELIAKSEEEAPNAVLLSWNLEADEDTNIPLFTGEFEEGNNEVDVHLNAETGEFLSVEND
ncbi:Peptidase propeptide and YPEB domain-containing protein [Carnobacterium alterfunditum]|uniref:Peptidase propeptide and YPEB domain-containing protein n=1 Tax=Carnobacterium alterfunditum TaxID=28230 RepID=A0A1N6EJI2_9LACT|nr:PepSY domain-containing protein [Carnobacterium alterfunditum]SIN83192.1 Peptidase propeptide and YPEB domain-containing protein [Carnobacterium alterfunditum]